MIRMTYLNLLGHLIIRFKLYLAFIGEARSTYSFEKIQESS